MSVAYARASGPYPAYPDLCTTLSQPSAQLWGDTLGAPVGTQTLSVGADLIVRSTDASTAVPLSVLLVKS